MALRKLKQESPGKILQKAEDSRSEGGLARLAHINYVIEFLNNLGKTTYFNNDAALAAGKQPGDIIALTNAPGETSLLAVVVEAVPAIMANFKWVACNPAPAPISGPDIYLSDAEQAELLAALGDPTATSFWSSDTEPPTAFGCYELDTGYAPGTVEQNMTFNDDIESPGITRYADCAACNTAHPIP